MVTTPVCELLPPASESPTAISFIPSPFKSPMLVIDDVNAVEK